MSAQLAVKPAPQAENSRLEWFLELWQAWMRADSPRLGYPTRSAGMAVGVLATTDAFELLCEAADEQAAMVVNALVSGLPPVQQAALYRAYGMAAVFRFPRDNYGEALEMAKGRVWRGILGRGLA